MNHSEIDPEPLDEEAVFHAAGQIDDETERNKYLNRVCREPEQRRRVSELLRAATTLDSFLSTPAIVTADATKPLAESVTPGSWIGRYRIDRLIGTGGGGKVFLATQTEPVHRTVAIKLIHAGVKEFNSSTESKTLIRRFRDEQQTLARLEHPGIARLIDAGATEAGQPFLVMEHVDGCALDDTVGETTLSIDQRLELFVQICAAVEHAHQKGIIHRDLKPSNVLVHTAGTDPRAKVIDFGIARLVNPDPAAADHERARQTAAGQLVGTPYYMAPEQLQSDRDVDTRTDVYALGGLLYFLFANHSPVERDGHQSLPEVFNAILHDDPPRLVEAFADDPPPPEIDWIVARALRKDPNERYASVAAMAEDVQHLRSGRPVSTGPPTWRYVTGKWINRNRWLAASIAAVLLAITIGGATAAFGLRQAKLALAGETRAKQTVIDQRDQAQQMVRLLGELADASNVRHQRPHDFTVREMLTEFSRSLDEKLADRPLVEARLRHVLGRSFLSYGDLQSARQNLTRAGELFATLDQVTPADTATLTLELGRMNHAASRFDEAAKQLSEAIASPHLSPLHRADALEELARMQRTLGRTDQAMRYVRQAMQLTDSPSRHARFASMLACLHLDRQEYDQADVESNAAMQAIDTVGNTVNELDVAMIQIARAEVLQSLGNYYDAGTLLRDAEKTQRALVGPSEALVRTVVTKSQVRRQNRTIRIAVRLANEAVEMADTLEINRGAASVLAYRNFALILGGHDDEESIRHWQKCCDLERDLLGASMSLVRDLYMAGVQALRAGKPNQAILWFDEAETMSDQAAEFPRFRDRLLLQTGIAVADAQDLVRANEILATLRKDSDAAAQFLDAEIQLAQGDLDAAAQIVERLDQQSSPRDRDGIEKGQWPWLRFRLALARGDREAAEAIVARMREEGHRRRGVLNTYVARAEVLLGRSELSQ